MVMLVRQTTIRYQVLPLRLMAMAMLYMLFVVLVIFPIEMQPLERRMILISDEGGFGD